MADRRHIIDIIINARDETAAAFAKATGNAEALKHATREQAREAENTRAAYKRMSEDINANQRELLRQREQVRASDAKQLTKMVELERAARSYAKTMGDASASERERVHSLQELQKAEDSLVKTYDEDQKADGRRTAQKIKNSNIRIEQAKHERDRIVEAGKEAQRQLDEQMRQGEAIAKEIEDNGQARHRAHMERLDQEAKQERELAEVRQHLAQQEQRQADEAEASRQASWQAEQDRIAREQKNREEAAQRRQALNKTLNDSEREADRIRIANAERENKEIQQRERNRAAAAREREQQQNRELSMSRQYVQSLSEINRLERERKDAVGKGDTASVARVDLDSARVKAEARGLAEELDRLLHVQADIDVDGAGAVAHAEAVKAQIQTIMGHGIKLDVDVDTDRLGRALRDVGNDSDNVNHRLGLMRGLISSVGSGFHDSSGKIASFDNYLRGLLSLGIAVFFQQLFLLATAAGGALLALASSALYAGGALAGGLTAGLAQAIPMLGIFATAMYRFKAVMDAAQQAQLFQQQQSYMGEKQDKRSADAADSLKSALVRQTEAIRHVTEAQQAVNDAREQARQKLEDLILAERGLHLSMAENEAAIRKAAGQGQTGALPRLFLRREETQQSLTRTTTEIQQRRSGTLPGGDEVQKAKENLRQARVAADQAVTAVEKARRGSDIASERINAAEGKLNFLLGRMSGAERRLFETTKKLQDAFRVVAQTITEPIINAANRMFTRIIAIFHDDRLVGAARSLAGSMASTGEGIFKSFTNPQALGQFERIMSQAKLSLKPFGEIIKNLGHAFLNIGEAGGPALRQILGWLSDITRKIDDFAEKGRKTGTLGDFFKQGVVHLKAWGDLLWQIIRLFAAIAGPGGGAKSGLEMVRSMAKGIRGWADDIREPGTKLNNFFNRLFTLSRQMIGSLGPIFRSLANEIDKTFNKDGVKSVKGFSFFIAQVLIPALGNFMRSIGRAFTAIAGFAEQHPRITKLASAFLATALAMSVVGRAASVFGFVIGPMKFLGKYALESAGGIRGISSALAGAAKWLAGFRQYFTSLTGLRVLAMNIGEAFASVGRAIAGFGSRILAFGRSIAGIRSLGEAVSLLRGGFLRLISILGPGGIIAIIVGILAYSGKLDDVFRGIQRAIQNVIGKVRQPFNELMKSVKGLTDAFGSGKGLMSVIKPIGDFIARVLIVGIENLGDAIGDVLGGAVTVLSGLIDVLTGLLTLDFDKIVGGLGKIGKGLLEGILGPIYQLGDIIVSLFKSAWNTLLGWLGIKSPSTRAKAIGVAIVDGIINGLKAIGGALEDAGRWIWGKVRGALRAEIRGWKAIGTWVWNAIKDAIHAVGHLFSSIGGWIWDQIKSAIRTEIQGFKNIGNWIWNTLSDAVHGIGSALESLGERIIKAIIRGIKKAPGAIKDAVGDLANKMPDLTPWKGLTPFAAGGPVVGGVAGRDSVRALLTPGEHVLTAMEVARAGGHDAIFAMRRALGGGGQGTGGRFRDGGAVAPANSGAAVAVQFSGNLEAFGEAWGQTWKDVVAVARRSANEIEAQLRDMRVNVTNTMNRLFVDFRSTWADIEDSGTARSRRLFEGVKKNIDQLQDTVYDGMRYISRSTNSALKSFDEKPIKLDVDAPKKAGGGMVGQPGERGRDKVLTYLGRGEAVLNWAQQKVVNSALWNQFGTTLPDMFKRNFAYHAGGPDSPGHARGGGDLFNGHPSNVNAGVRRIIQTMKARFPLMVSSTTDHDTLTTSGNVSDHVKGAAVDLSGAKEIMNRAASYVLHSGMVHKLKQAIYSGNPSLTWSGGQNVGPGYFGSDVMSQHTTHLHLAIAGALKGIFGTANIGKMLVTGTNGGMKTLAQAVINAVRKAANKMLDSKGGGTDQHTAFKDPGGQYNKDDLIKLWELAGGPGGRIANIAAAIALAESGGDPNAGASHPYHGLWQVGPGGSFDPMENARQAVAKYKAAHGFTPWTTYTGFDTPNHEKTYLRYLSTGGIPQFKEGGQVPGGEGQPQPIIAHAGEWILNKMQQAKLAQAMGTTTSALKRLLGFGAYAKRHFKDGGEVTIEQARMRQIRRGSYEAPAVNPEDLDGIIREVGKVNLAIRRMSQKGNLGKRIDRFMKNLGAITDEDGAIDQMATAIDTLSAKLQRTIDLAKVGFRRVNNRLRRITPLTDAVKIAQDSIDMYGKIGDALKSERKVAERGLTQVNQRLRALRRGGVTKGEKDQYVELMAARKRFTDTLADVDTKIAEAASSRWDARKERFDAVTAAALKPGQSDQKVAEMASRLGNLLGDTSLVERAGNAQLDALRDQQAALVKRARAAAKKAKSDPRWQATADDLAQQVADGQQAIAEQIAQNLSDVIDVAERAATRRTASIDRASKLNDLRERAGDRLGAIRNRMGLSDQRSAEMTREHDELGALRERALREGNIKAAQDLTDKMEDLNVSIAEENQTRQDLIDTYRSAATDVITGRTAQTTGLISAGQGIMTSLGTAAGFVDPKVIKPFLEGIRDALVGAAKDIAANVRDAISQNEFGPQGSSLLSQLVTAFNQGPAAFAQALLKLGPSISAFAATLGPEAQSAWNAVIASMVDNTTATVENSSQLADLTAQTKEPQTFTSSAWTLFRQAIFDGNGNLLPQYQTPTIQAMGIPMAKASAIAPTSAKPGNRSSSFQADQSVHVTVNESDGHIDETYLANRIAWDRKTSNTYS